MIRFNYVGYWPPANDMPRGTNYVKLVRTDVVKGELVMTLRYVGPAEPKNITTHEHK